MTRAVEDRGQWRQEHFHSVGHDPAATRHHAEQSIGLVFLILQRRLKTHRSNGTAPGLVIILTFKKKKKGKKRRKKKGSILLSKTFVQNVALAAKTVWFPKADTDGNETEAATAELPEFSYDSFPQERWCKANVSLEVRNLPDLRVGE